MGGSTWNGTTRKRKGSSERRGVFHGACSRAIRDLSRNGVQSNGASLLLISLAATNNIIIYYYSWILLFLIRLMFIR